ncbi:MAG: DUF3347 domain-containing protein [Pedobacter sp.]|nr:DUF3347 domain-containing protein [Pedobacter sp.]MDQ8052488.1 DUF3347 domain-containing protein [Pedobacter sp.]
MKRIFLIIALLSTTIIFAAAQQAKINTAYNNTLKAYFELKNALAKDQVDLAGQGAKNLVASIKAFPVAALAAGQQTAWKMQTAEIMKYAEPIISAKDLKLQRKSFEGLASPVIKLARTFKYAQQPLYVQYCPMVKRSWLNDVEAIQNPFYGSKMYDCGEVTETLSK